MIRSIVLIGSGNLAEALAHALTEGEPGADPEKPRRLVQLWARNPVRAAAVAEPLGVPWSSDPAALVRTADLYLISVSDRAVAGVAATLPIPDTAVVAHTAGSVPLDALGRFPRRAILYPLQSFTAGRRVDFRSIPLFLECADPILLPELEAFARTLSGEVRYADSARRALIHLAGVFANNFTNRMYGLAAEVLRRADLPYDVLKPLLLETAAKAADAADPAAVQTGPAVRGDRATQERHLGLLAEEPLARTLYELISKNIWETSKKI